MKILYRYIGARLAFGWLLVFLIMASLFSILELVAQLDDIGKGGYRMSDAFMYVVYTTPGRVLNLVAVSTLLGSIVALGSLSASDELMAMRAGGFSVIRIAWVVLGAGLPIMLGVVLLTQYVVPPLEQRAKINRELALADTGTLLPAGGFWTRDSNRFVNVSSFTYDGGLLDVSIYEFDGEGKPTSCVFARKAEIGSDGQWSGRDVREISLAVPRGFDRKTATLPMGVFLNTRQAEILSITPAMLSLDNLYQYILALRARGQNVDQFVLALWQKTTLPLKVGAMLLFSFPFVFSSAREAHQGRKITLGAVVGISYYYFDQALGYTGLLLGLHPAITTLLPLGIILLMSTWFLLRIP